MRDFVKQGREEMYGFVTKAIKDLLEKLDSKIKLPTNKDGEMENKLYAVVQSREEVYRSACELMDLISLEDSEDQEFKDKIIRGLKTTWHELTKIVTRNIGISDVLSLEEWVNSDDSENIDRVRMNSDEIKKHAMEQVTDDVMTSIAKAKYLASKVSFQILDRIEMLENPDAINDKIKETQTTSIIERYVENR